MKTLISFCVCLLFSMESFGFSIDLDYIRNHYQQAVSDKKLCEEMINELEKVKDTNVYLAYLGSFQTIWANHVTNPFSKLRTFRKGKENIEKAINSDSNNIEIRLIRLSVQKNCPSFLGYSKNINEDEQFIGTHKKDVQSESLMKFLDTVLNK
ncbi:hypothetical protein [Flavobacterium sp. 5]|uniref:hypothetical protein n=1 Tax=Flavobacterium sp. 5 TaxID=2035199 RepID=UPI000C2CB58F|nr:hypothetical protein [Flavobacterium sp. 5]PKB14985.1 hypothetical protein CLU82_0031 [Flavobacterium sp. 5]